MAVVVKCGSACPHKPDSLSLLHAGMRRPPGFCPSIRICARSRTLPQHSHSHPTSIWHQLVFARDLPGPVALDMNQSVSLSDRAHAPPAGQRPMPPTPPLHHILIYARSCCVQSLGRVQWAVVCFSCRGHHPTHPAPTNKQKSTRNSVKKAYFDPHFHNQGLGFFA